MNEKFRIVYVNDNGNLTEAFRGTEQECIDEINGSQIGSYEAYNAWIEMV